MLFTGDTLAPNQRRRGLAIEPMTCPPNALQSGEGVVRLAPGNTFTARWGIEPAS
jgi:aldose 1-epimerase